MQIKTEQIDEYPAPSVEPTAAIAAELDVAKEVLVAQAGKLQVHEQHARILQANYDKLMAFVGDQVGQLRGVAGELELRAENVREAVAARERFLATDRATETAKAWESQIHDKYAKILQANNVRLVSFVEDLRDQLRVVASELELRVGDVRAALAVKDKAGARDPKVKRCAEARAAKEASLIRSLQSAEIDHAERMKAAEAAHAESLKALTDRLRAAEEAHARKTESAAAAHAESLKALDDRMLAAEQVNADKLKGVEHAYAYNLKAVAHINAERLAALEKAHAETLKALKEKLSAEEEAHAEKLSAEKKAHTVSFKVVTDQLNAAEEAHAVTLKALTNKLSAAEKAHTVSFKVVTDQLNAAEEGHAETVRILREKLSATEKRGPEPRPRRREEEDVIDALSKYFEFAPPFSSLDECKKSGFLAKPGFISHVLADLKKQGSLKGLTNTGLLVRLEQRGYPRVRFEARAGNQLKSWVVGVKKMKAPKLVRECENNESKIRELERNRQDKNDKARDEAHAESLRARDKAHAETEAVLTEKLRSAEEAVQTKAAVLKRLFRASRGLLEVHLGTLMDPEAVASCMAMTEPAKIRNAGKRKRLEFSKTDDCIEESAPKLIEWSSPKLIEGSSPQLIEGSSPQLIEGSSPQLIDASPSIPACPDRNEVVQHGDCEDTNTISVACATRSMTIVPPMRSKRLRAVV